MIRKGDKLRFVTPYMNDHYGRGEPVEVVSVYNTTSVMDDPLQIATVKVWEPHLYKGQEPLQKEMVFADYHFQRVPPLPRSEGWIERLLDWIFR